MFPLNLFLVQNIHVVIGFLREISVSILKSASYAGRYADTLGRFRQVKWRSVSTKRPLISGHVWLCIDSFMTIGTIFGKSLFPEIVENL